MNFPAPLKIEIEECASESERFRQCIIPIGQFRKATALPNEQHCQV
jgi:hypothetical protein